MQNENQVIQPTNPVTPPAPAQPQVAEQAAKWTNPYETFLLLFGCTAVFSLLTGNGVLLKIAAAVFLLFGLMAIAKGIPLRGEASGPKSFTDSNGVTYKIKRPWTLLRILGTAVLVIVLVPVVGYLGLMLLFILMFSMGGGRMGT